MSETLATVLAQAMQLPAAERGELIDRLADSLDPPEGLGEIAENEFTAELNRRATELRADPTSGIPWDDVKGMR